MDGSVRLVRVESKYTDLGYDLWIHIRSIGHVRLKVLVQKGHAFLEQ